MGFWMSFKDWIKLNPLPAVECPSTQAVAKKRRAASTTIHRLLQAEIYDETGKLYPIPGGNNG